MTAFPDFYVFLKYDQVEISLPARALNKDAMAGTGHGISIKGLGQRTARVNYKPLLKSSLMSSRAMIMRRISDVPAPISHSF